MAPEAQTQQGEEFVLDFTPETREKITPNDGGTRPKINPGDYRLRVEALKKQAKTGEKPHVMAAADFKIVHAYDSKNAMYVGFALSGLYAGSPQSPDFMQQRLEQFLRALQYKGTPGRGVNAKELIGREFDACVVRELGKPETDPATGATRRYTNDRVKYERAVGAPKPPQADAIAESREALAWEEKGGMAAEPDVQTQMSPPSFAQGAPAQAPAAAVAIAAQAPAASPWRDEASLKADPKYAEYMIYRVYVAIGHEQAAQIKQVMESLHINPTGPIDLAALSPEVKSHYLAKVPQAAAASGLPTLGPIGGNATSPAAA